MCAVINELDVFCRAETEAVVAEVPPAGNQSESTVPHHSTRSALSQKTKSGAVKVTARGAGVERQNLKEQYIEVPVWIMNTGNAMNQLTGTGNTSWKL